MHNLNERIKELNCLYGISKLVENSGLSLTKIIQGTVDIIPLSWQYPEITCARVIIDYHEFRTKKFNETIWKQESEIFVNGNCCGRIEVYYMKKKPESDEGPFMKEERNLLNAIAERLGKIIEHKKTEEQLGLMQKELEIKAHTLEETNTALKVLLKHQDSEKEEMEKDILTNVKMLVFPYLEKVKIETSEKKTKTYINIIISNLNKITKPFISRIKDYQTKLTPTEIQIAHLIRENKTTKDIAVLLNISETTVNFHRQNIRYKLGINNKKTNLRSFLQSLNDY
ncbi:MAG TPA: helix-turn-helix transcriptional regulator, partial [Anaerolineae bacterium]|nr:helix-turn-helix transcriptional regulator [Anaerolineae bacterium]